LKSVHKSEAEPVECGVKRRFCICFGRRLIRARLPKWRQSDTAGEFAWDVRQAASLPRSWKKTNWSLAPRPPTIWQIVGHSGSRQRYLKPPHSISPCATRPV